MLFAQSIELPPPRPTSESTLGRARRRGARLDHRRGRVRGRSRENRIGRDAGRLAARRAPAPRSRRRRCRGRRRASARRKPSSRASSPSRDSVPGPKTRRMRLACSNGFTSLARGRPRARLRQRPELVAVRDEEHAVRGHGASRRPSCPACSRRAPSSPCRRPAPRRRRPRRRGRPCRPRPGRGPDRGEHVVGPVDGAGLGVERVQEAAEVGDVDDAVLDRGGRDRAADLVVVPDAAASA